MTVSSTVPDIYSFHCTACGKCCNSPPQMSLPELFYHQDIFVGCLAIKRFKSVVPGARVNLNALGHEFSGEDRYAFAELFGALLFKSNPLNDQGHYIALFTQAFDYPSQLRCPALAENEQCSIHHDRLPTLCAAVPMDPLVPDHLQHIVLASRNTAENFFGANCIVEGERDEFVSLTRNGAIADVSYQDATRRRRVELAADKAWWGNSVFAALRKELFDSAASYTRIPFDGFFYISLVPVLMEVALLSGYGRDRCLTYLEAQLRLIDKAVKSAIARNKDSDKPTTHQLRAWAKSYGALQKALATSTPRLVENLELRAWLG